MKPALALVLLLGCAPSAPARTALPSGHVAQAPPVERKQTSSWPIPAGWRSEVIPFPLDFAPSIAHRGFEELRFPPGFFDPRKSDYWSYAFTWRTEDAAELDAQALGDELTAYFKGLIEAVDEKNDIGDRDRIVARAVADGAGRFKLTAHVFDAFKTKLPIDLTGWASRRACGTGAVWVFVLAPDSTTIRSQLDELAAAASC